MTSRAAADVVAEMLYAWTRECGRPLVLSGEDREQIAEVIEECLPKSVTTEDEASCEGDCGYHVHGNGE